jgi:hypothetical protein
MKAKAKLIYIHPEFGQRIKIYSEKDDFSLDDMQNLFDEWCRAIGFVIPYDISCDHCGKYPEGSEFCDIEDDVGEIDHETV